MTDTLPAVYGIDRTTDGFRRALIDQAKEAGLNADYIAAVISVESGFRANIQNLGGAPALGLIQFWRDYWAPIAKRAGRPDVKWEELRTMSAEEQVPFVLAYYKGTKLPRLGGSATPGDYYMATFMPAFVGKPESFVLGRKGSTERLAGLNMGKVYAQNKGLDVDGDGEITVGDVGRKVTTAYGKASRLARIEVPEKAKPGGTRLGLFFCPSCGSLLEVKAKTGGSRE